MVKSTYSSHITDYACTKGGERMNEYMPTDIQFKDDLRKEEIRIENELELLENKEYEKLKKKLERDLKRVRESLQD